MKTITFYSYKGGVGRSLALVNIATRLAEFGKKVCLLDFDLEAPGLHLKFGNFLSEQAINQGIVDYISEYTTLGHLPEKILDYTVSFSITNNSSPIHIIPAGNINSSDYWKKLSSINWHELLYENDNGLAFFLELKQKIEKEVNPDFLLIDSRTGISEMSGISISLLADEVVVVAANNKENLGGAKRIIHAISNPANSLFGKTPKISFVLSRIPFTDKPEDKMKELGLTKSILRQYLSPIVKEVNVIHSDRELEENERIKIAYEKDESISQSSRDYLLLFEKLTKDDLSEQEIIRFRNIRESEKLYQRAISSSSDTEKISLISQAIALNPNNIDFHIFKASLQNTQGQFDEAFKSITDALVLNEQYPIALEGKVDILINMARYEEARFEIDKILEIDKNNISAQLALGMINVNQGFYDKALEIYTQLIVIYPDLSEGYNMLAHVKRLKGDLDGALKDIYKALELDTDFGILYATLAEINADRGNEQDFFLHFENALRLSPSEMKKEVNEDRFYQRFFNNERFKFLLEKYDIALEATSDSL